MIEEGIDPRTPVLVGGGQSIERIDDPGFAGLSPVALAAAAATAALNDTGAAPGRVAAAVDVVAGIRQFEVSTPAAVAPFGRSDNFPRSVAARVGADPRHAILELTGGQGPQHLVTELAGAIHAGEAEVALLFGAEAMSTVRALSGTDRVPDWSEEVGGQLDDRGFGLEGVVTEAQLEHRLGEPAHNYALFENARRARVGLGRADYAAAMGALFAPFTAVAAGHPVAAARDRRTAEDLVTVTERNRVVVDPYPKALVARDMVNQGAAVLLASVAAARRLGIPPERRVFLHGHSDLRERDLLERADLAAAPSQPLAVRRALAQAGIGLDELRYLDLYSCFPIAVSAVCDGLGLAEDDPRGLTVTGGLPFFGGPGNDYSMHAIATLAQLLRAAPGSFGLVGANGGFLSKYSVGVYSTTPAPWRAADDAAAQRELDAVPAPPSVRRADGPATIETFTVTYPRTGPVGIVVGRLDADGSRFLATTEPGDDRTLALLATEQPVGARVLARATDTGNRVTAAG